MNTVLVFLALLSFAIAHPTVLRTPSGRNVPIAHLQHHVKRNGKAESLSLVEHHGDHVILSDRRLHIPSLAPRTVHLDVHPRLSINLNGKPAIAPTATVQRGPRHTFVFVHSGQRKILAAAWGPGLSLHPVHVERHPDVLVNLERDESEGETFNLSDDIADMTVSTGSPFPTPSPLPVTIIDERMASRVQVEEYEQVYDMTDDVAVAPQGVSTSPSPSPALPPLSSNFRNVMRQATSGCGPNDPARNVEIAISFSNAFCAMQGDSAPITFAAIQALVLLGNEPFQKQTCVRLALTHVDGYCKSSSDPYSPPSDMSSNQCPPGWMGRCSAARKILEKFMSAYRNPPRSGVARDLAYFLSGYDDGTTTSGMAFRSSACNSNSGFAFSERLTPIIFAHEVGHTLGAPHNAIGIMREEVGSADALDFSDNSVRAITDFVAKDPSASCLTGGAPTCDDTCPGRCVRNMCVATAPSKIPSGLVSCVPISTEFQCTKLRDIGGRTFSFAVDCPSGFDFVEPLPGSKSARFCCKAPSESDEVDGITSESSVGPLVFRFADGRRERFEKYVLDQDKVTKGTLMKTSLSPDCSSSSSSATTNAPVTTTSRAPQTTTTTTSRAPRTTTTAAQTTSEATTTITTTTTTSKTSGTRITAETTTEAPTTSSEMTSSTTAATTDAPKSTEMTTTSVATTPEMRSTRNNERSCADTFTAGRGPVCQSVVLGTMLRPGMPLIVASLRQRSGTFILTLSSLGEFRSAGTKMQVARAAEEKDVELSPMVKTGMSVELTVKMDTVMTVGEDDTCCGRRLFVAIKANICGRDGMECREIYEWFGTPVKCGDPCRGRSGTPIAMSLTNVCQRCDL